MRVLEMPLYIPLRPPEAANPPDDCSLVFNVSSGNSITSTLVPATAPASKHVDSEGASIVIALHEHPPHDGPLFIHNRDDGDSDILDTIGRPR